MQVIVQVENLWKFYGRVTALNNVSLLIPKGSIYLLMGPNGSGKTTLIKILTGLLKPSRGTVEVLGLNPWRHRDKLFRVMGVSFEDHSPPDWATAKDFLEYMASLKGSKDPEKDALDAARIFGVDEFWDDPISTYSSGMKRRVALAHAFLLNPKLVVLDDPTIALDEQSRSALRKALIEGSKMGKTFFIASHEIAGLEKCITHIAVLDSGKLKIAGAINDVAAKMKETDLWGIYAKALAYES
jgi:ABC-2 type transport system ATP-binding protein